MPAKRKANADQFPEPTAECNVDASKYDKVIFVSRQMTESWGDHTFEFKGNDLVHEDTKEPLSLCSQYLKWLYPERRFTHDELREGRKFIDLGQGVDGKTLYFFKRGLPLEDFFRPPSQLGMAE